MQARALLWAVVWAILYLLLNVVLPVSNATVQQYHLTGAEFRVLAFLTGLPLVIVWCTAFFGYASLADYAEKIGDSSEGISFRSIARGLKWLSWGLPISGCVDITLGGITHLNPQLQSISLIISHYVYLVISLVAFTYMSDGSRGLRDIVKQLPSKNAIRGMIGMCIIISVTYCSVTLDTVANQHPNSYRLPLWLILLTIIIPYLYAWLMGFFAVFEISQYRHTIRGLFYKQALQLLAAGTGFAIVASVALQFLSSSSPYLRIIMLNWRLVVSYLIMITFAVGFLLIMVGVAKLKKIEEI